MERCLAATQRVKTAQQWLRCRRGRHLGSPSSLSSPPSAWMARENLRALTLVQHVAFAPQKEIMKEIDDDREQRSLRRDDDIYPSSEDSEGGSSEERSRAEGGSGSEQARRCCVLSDAMIEGIFKSSRKPLL